MTRQRSKYLYSTAEALAKGEAARLSPPSELEPCTTCEGHGFVDSDPCVVCDGTGQLTMSDEDIAILKADEKRDSDRGK